MPAPQALTVRGDYSLVELPDDCYAPRRFDPRVAFIRLTVYDHASPITSRWKRAGSSATGVKRSIRTLIAIDGTQGIGDTNCRPAMASSTANLRSEPSRDFTT